MAVRPGVKIASLALAGVGTAAIVAVWSYREPIARGAIDDYLHKRGVIASYDIRAIETRRQRLENIRIGDPKAPDLTADWAEIDVGPSLTGLSVRAVRAGGVRLHGRIVGGTLSLGAVDRLLPTPTDAPFTLPDIDLSLEDARMRLETPRGQIGGKLDGQGNLRSGFEGKMALVAPRLDTLGGCTATAATAYGDVSIVGRRPTFSGPVRLAALNCGAVVARGADVQVDASIAEDASDWRGTANLRLATAQSAGLLGRASEATVTFDGSARKTDADLKLVIGTATTRGVTASRLSLSGKATFGMRGTLFQGQMRAARILPGILLDGAARQLAALPDATPVSPAAQQLAAAIRGLSRGFGGHADVDASFVDGASSLTLSDMAFASASGASLVLPGDKVVSVDAGGIRLAGNARFGGGGFPGGMARLNGQSGTILFQPYQARGARIALTPVRFAVRPTGLAVNTVATIDGPLGAGRIGGLVVPLRLAPGQVMPSGCGFVAFRQLRVDTLALGPTRLRTCLSAREATLSDVRLRGAMGGAPLILNAAHARYAFGNGVFGVNAFSAQLGDASRRSALTADAVTGRVLPAGFGGRFEGVAGHVGTVPLLVSQGRGAWILARGALALNGQASVADAAAERRFLPLDADGLVLRVGAGKVEGQTILREPKSGADIANVTFRHDLSSGHGSADIDVAGLTFSNRLQPEAITTKTLGVVANVMGTIRGAGRVDWSGDVVRSTGRFRTSGLDFAAAFGPVQGMKGEISFTDLLGLVTAPDQEVEIANINPGITVTEGRIRYRLLPDFRAQLDGGRWPFAGGSLVLDPTVLDLSSAAPRHLTFRVEGLDAARFIAAMEFENIAATGIYDGQLPMVFDDQGGRIEGGRIVARGGGTLSYVGQVSNENLGTMGRFAFDALKSMKYERLAIDLNGAIDGDVITRISFAGVNQAPLEGGRAKLPIKIIGATNLPFIFNVTITAKFRQLFEMARSFNDPSILINRVVPRLEPLPKDERKPLNPVQPPESAPKQ